MYHVKHHVLPEHCCVGYDLVMVMTMLVLQFAVAITEIVSDKV